MLTPERLDRIQKRLELWDEPRNPISVNTGLELVALARKGLDAERLEREAAYLANRLTYCPDEDDPEAYWHICKGDNCEGPKEDMAACWRRAASVAVEESQE